MGMAVDCRAGFAVRALFGVAGYALPWYCWLFFSYSSLSCIDGFRRASRG
jgi:hypothetical protein